jgi:hypothetical protein
VATVPLTAIVELSQLQGWTRMSLPYLVGTLFTGRPYLAMALGGAAHVAFGAAFALLYALAFEQLGRASWWLGALFGTYHAAFVLTVLVQLLPDFHPRMAGEHHGPDPTPLLQPPGFLALHYGTRTPLLTLAAHVVYGAVIGAGYQP